MVVNYAGPVVPPILASGKLLSDGSFQTTFSGPKGQTYKLLASSNLFAPLADWTVLTSGTFGDDPVTYTDPDAATLPARFYCISSP